MKKGIPYILILLTVLFSFNINLNGSTYEEEFQKLKPMDLDEVINSIYLEFGISYNKEKINKETLRIYRVPAYNNPKDVSVKYQFVNGVKQYEYLGYAPNGEKITNSLYPPDGDMTGKYVDDLSEYPWIENPLDSNNKKSVTIKKLYYAVSNELDYPFNLHLREKYLENFLLGVELTYHEYLRYHYEPDLTKEFEVSDAPINWAKYYHIIVPPTEHTFGVARLWFVDYKGQIRYMDSLLGV